MLFLSSRVILYGVTTEKGEKVVWDSEKVPQKTTWLEGYTNGFIKETRGGKNLDWGKGQRRKQAVEGELVMTYFH